MEASVEVKIFKTPRKVVKAMAKGLIKITNATSQSRFDIALSGGKTPELFFEVLASKYPEGLPWDKIHFWWGDERCVPADSKESNYKLANDCLISKVPVPPENVHRIKGEEDPEKEAVVYGDEIDSQLNMRGEWPVFDLIILGLGNDGHTASIFPDQIELFETDANCAVSEHPITGQKRITLTGSVINNANRVFFLVTGKSKAMRISEIMNDEEAAKLLPAYYIHPENGELTWFIDEEAATLIS
jgi:6-phosphogluconolactonase